MKKILLSSLLATALLTTTVSAETAKAPTKQEQTVKMVTTKNFVRAESDMQMNAYIKSLGAFGKLVHSRKMYDVTKQLTIRPNTDTLYSFGIFDLTQPLDLEMPKTSRYQSAMVISQDHSAFAEYTGKHTITQKEVGTRYVFILVRTFVDPNDKSDLEKAHATQDKIKVSQKSMGKFEIPNWDEKSLKTKRKELVELGELLPNTEGMFGIKKDLNPVIHLVGAAYGWAGLSEKDALYDLSSPKQNDGKAVHTLSVKDVPVDGFWSLTVYNKDGYFDITQPLCTKST